MLYPILRSRERVPNLWDDIFTVRGEFDRLLDRWSNRPAGEVGWMPVVDVRETANELLVQVELPGMKADDVDVRVEDGVLTISGEKRQEIEEGKEESSYHLIERRYGRFERSFTLPRGVDADKVQARFGDGVLTIALPKAETAKPRRIEVKVGNGVSKK